MGSKGGGEQTSTVYQNALPEYARPYFESLMERGQAESTRPYQPYGGQRLADQSPQMTAGLNMGQQFAQSGLPMLANANSLANLVGQQAINYQNYQPGGVTNTYTGPQAWSPGQFNVDQVNADKVGFGGDIQKVGSQNFGAAQAGQYMSPYMGAVTEAAQADAQRKAAEEQAYIKANQGTSGAFGGSRGAIQQQIAANEAQRRISDIGVQGKQAAYENAQQQFERDQQRLMGAQGTNLSAAMQMAQGNQQYGLQAQLANQAKNLEALGMGEQSRQFGYELGEQGRQRASELGMLGQYQTEQLRQGGQQLGLQGLQLAGDTAGQLAGFQGLTDSMALSRMQAMLGVGQSIDDRSQRGLDLSYEDYMNQQGWPRQNLNFMSQLMHGVPTGSAGTQTTTTPSNPLAGIAGTYLGYQALQRLGGFGGGQPPAT